MTTRIGKEPEPRPQPIEIFVTQKQAEELHNISNATYHAMKGGKKGMIDGFIRSLPGPSIFWQDISSRLETAFNEYHPGLGLISLALLRGEEIQIRHNPDAQNPNSYKDPFLFYSSLGFPVGMSEAGFSSLLTFLSPGTKNPDTSPTAILTHIKSGQPAIIKPSPQPHI